MKPIVACSTSDGEKLFSDNFGDAPYFHLYKISARGNKFLEELENISREELKDQEADEDIKAKNISSLLKAKSANVLLAHQMGPHLARISKNFVPIISRERNLEVALESVKDKTHLVEREWRKGESREYIILEES